MSIVKLVRITFFVLATLFLMVIPFYCHAQFATDSFILVKKYKVDTLVRMDTGDTSYRIRIKFKKDKNFLKIIHTKETIFNDTPTINWNKWALDNMQVTSIASTGRATYIFPSVNLKSDTLACLLLVSDTSINIQSVVLWIRGWKVINYVEQKVFYLTYIKQPVPKRFFVWLDRII